MKKNLMKTLVVIVGAILLLSGCAGLPNEKQIQSDLESYDDGAFLGEGEKITKVEIKNRNTDKKQKYDIVQCDVTVQDSKVSCMKQVTLRYELLSKEWELTEGKVNESNAWIITPLKGVTEDDIIESLDEDSIEVNGESWEITKDEITDIKIEKQDTDLEKKTDKVKASVTLDSGVETVTGEVLLDYSFDGGWRRKNISSDKEFEVQQNEDVALNATEDLLIKDLCEQTVKQDSNENDLYVSYANSENQAIVINKDQVSDFQIDEQKVTEKGWKQSFACKWKLTKPTVVYTMSANIIYSYNGTDGWNCQVVDISSQVENIDIAGEWKGYYTGVSEKGDATLNITSVDGNKITATYYYAPKNPNEFSQPGSYNVSGTIDTETLMLNLAAGDWINEPENPLSIEKQDIIAHLLVEENKLEGLGQSGYPFMIEKQ